MKETRNKKYSTSGRSGTRAAEKEIHMKGNLGKQMVLFFTTGEININGAGE